MQSAISPTRLSLAANKPPSPNITIPIFQSKAGPMRTWLRGAGSASVDEAAVGGVSLTASILRVGIFLVTRAHFYKIYRFHRPQKLRFLAHQGLDSKKKGSLT